MQKVDLLAARQFEQQVQRAFIPAYIDCEQVASFGVLRVCRERVNGDHVRAHAAPAICGK